LELLIRFGQGSIDTFNHIAQMAPSNVDIQDFTTKGFQTSVGGMERTFHVAYQCLQTRLEQLTFHYAGGQFSPDNSATFGTDKTVQTVFSNGNRIVNKFNGLLNFRLLKRLARAFVATITTMCIKRDRFINSIWPKWLSVEAFMPRLTALMAGTIGLFGFRRLNNIRGWRFGRVRGILGEFSHLFSKLGVDFEKFGNLFFQSCVFNLQVGNLLLIELFSFRCQFLSSRHLQQLLSGERGLPLKNIWKNTDYFLEFQCCVCYCVCYKVNWKITCWVFDVVCVGQYCQNTPERLLFFWNFLLNCLHIMSDTVIYKRRCCKRSHSTAFGGDARCCERPRR